MSSAVVLLAVTAVLLAAGAVLLLGGGRSRRDATGSRAAGALADGGESYRQALLNNLSDAVIACDAQGRLSLLNPVARAWLGPLNPSGHFDLFGLDGVTPLARDNVPLARAFKGDTLRNLEVVIAPPDRPPRFVLCSGGPILDSDSNKIGAVVVMRDITEQRDAGQERLLALARVQRQHEALLRLGSETIGPSAGLDDNARLISEVCADTLEVNATSLWLFDQDRRALRCLDRFERAPRRHSDDDGGGETQPALPAERSPRYLQALRDARVIDAFDARVDLRVREWSEGSAEVDATLEAGIRLNGELIGVLRNEHAGGTRRWTVDEANFAAAAADQMAQCLTAQERRRTTQSLRDAEQRFRALYDENPAMFFTVDGENRIVAVNHFAASQLGYHVAELLGQPFTAILAETDHATALLRHASVLNAPPEGIHRWTTRQLARDGSRMPLRQTARRVQDADGRTQVLYVCEEVTETRRLSEKLDYETRHDTLTGLLNRREFERQLRAALAEDNRGPAALIYLDLDQFKIINESASHAAGDRLLRQVGEVLVAQLADRGVVARLGGDEFAILLRDHSIEPATQLAETLRQALRELEFSWEDKRFRIGASFGVVPISRDSGEMEGILQAADAAVYLAKNQGRDRVHVYQADDANLAQRRNEMQWASRIRSALEDNRLQLVRHRIAPLKTPSQGHHYELLLRLVDGSGTLTRDAHFLSAAEQYGFATEIDAWVVSTALDWLAHHPAHLEELHLCCINLSGLSLGDEIFLQLLSSKLRAGSVPPEKICFEITETAAIANLSRATEFMRALRELGCKFSLDDFGSGLSSYAYLRDLEVDFLKIDGSFVRNIADDPVDFALLRSMNEIGQLLGKKTIAEFAENDRVIEKLREAGVDYIQGHGVSRPVPLDAPDDEG